MKEMVKNWPGLHEVYRGGTKFTEPASKIIKFAIVLYKIRKVGFVDIFIIDCIGRSVSVKYKSLLNLKVALIPTNMFKKFDEKESISGILQLKSSVQKGIRSKLVESYPHLEGFIDNILPKKDSLRIVKCHDHIEIIVNSAGELLFFRHREGPWMPTLRLFHKYPFFLPMQQVDKGAIRFVLSGANIMCPGLTSPGAKMTEVPKDTIVAIMAEGKQHALAIGKTTLSSEDIAKVNKGIGVENCHYLNDGLWQMKPVK